MSEPIPGIVQLLDDKIIEIVKANSNGIRNRDVINILIKEFPTANTNTINTRVSDVHNNHPDKIEKLARGVLTPVYSEIAEGACAEGSAESQAATGFKESDFYMPFAEWLVGEADEATIAVPLGGAPIKTKWSNPDVVGSYKSRPTDIYQFPVQLLVAEIKIDSSQSVTAFGQAMAYRLFAHRVYIVMPSTIPKGDQSRLESLCLQHDIGLVIFDLNQINPNFQNIIRAQSSSPDIFYTNEFLERIKLHDNELLNQIL
jgi:hypothetical protein